MMFPRERRLRTSLIFLLVVTTLVTLTIVGSAILIVRLPLLVAENQTTLRTAVDETANRVEVFLQGLESRVSLVAQTLRGVPKGLIQRTLEATRGSDFADVYLINADGVVINISVGDDSKQKSRELVGVDFSNNQLFQEVRKTKKAAWSNKYLSSVSGEVTIGVALPVIGTGGVIIAEIPLKTLLQISRIASSHNRLDFWIVDGRGEVVADTGSPTAIGMNLLNLPIVYASLSKRAVPDSVTFKGIEFQAAASFSKALGWLFVSRVPAGLKNHRIQETVGLVLIAFVASPVVGFLLAPFWARRMTGSIRRVTDRARMVANGAPPGAWPKGDIIEFNQLSSDLESMSTDLQQRQSELRDLNENLEARVERRTHDLAASNAELSDTLSKLNRTQNELVHSEKMAALGRLVAGVAHELNTPIGNGRMAVTALRDSVSAFESKMKAGLRRSDLTELIGLLSSSTLVAERNMVRAAELISSFKQVAVDRTASHRRRFQIREIVDEIILTLSPVFKKRSITVTNDIPSSLCLESYAGDLGQVLTNLLENAERHAFADDESGSILMSAEMVNDREIRLVVEDDGCGMDSNVAERIFDPFFTTKMQSGGTGLGMHITYNLVVGVLGGTIFVSSVPGEGSRFEILLPIKAPEEKVA